MSSLFKFIISNIIIFLTLSFASLAFAATPPAPSTGAQPSQQPVPVATVNIQNTSFSQQGNAFNISFDLTNRTGVQPDVRYAVELVSQVKGLQTVADEKVYPDVVQLGENSSVHKNITYTAPTGLSGSYQLVIVSQNSSGFPFGVMVLGTVKLTATGGIEIDPGSCYLQVAGEKSGAKYSLVQGVDIAPSETLQLHCQATNMGTAAVQAIPQYETHYRTSFGSVVQQQGGDTAPINFGSRESKAIDLALPKAQDPQAYNVNVTLKSFGGLSNAMVVHYVLRGVSATIQAVNLDKDYYAASNQATLTFMWSPSADSFNGARAHSAAPSATIYTATLSDGSGTRCAAPVSGNLTNMRMETTIPVTANCSNPRVMLKLEDQNGTVLAQKEVAFQSQSNPTTNSTWMLVVILLLCCLILFAIFKYNRHLAIKVLLPLLMVAGITAGAGFPLHFALADTFCSGGYHYWGGNESFWDNCEYYYTVNLNNSSYPQGASMNLSGQRD